LRILALTNNQTTGILRTTNTQAMTGTSTLYQATASCGTVQRSSR